MEKILYSEEIIHNPYFNYKRFYVEVVSFGLPYKKVREVSGLIRSMERVCAVSRRRAKYKCYLDFSAN